MDSNQPKVNTSAVGNETNPAQTVAEGKGKGKAVDLASQDVSMGEEDSSSDEETGAEDEVCFLRPNAAFSHTFATNTPRSQAKEERTSNSQAYSRARTTYQC